ncbi:hypothetical protein SISNIDRAFT_470066 [Sistotremastrum niveocremeum HHB9708]|uniref:G-protein coupled receptors family 1 profile domain-containing protein n=1 Tax=Sistotremastrum niveocremeum HHB9708 TaxID=1314777 RepID=A0A164PDK8_9AGAM|nr:hypothetical protein SISNIDRAFT_470066 [Sistotremastrum niveocremeum HHB9708]
MWLEDCTPTADGLDRDTRQNAACNFGFPTRLGLSIVVEMALISAIATASLIGFILYTNAKKWLRWRAAQRRISDKSRRRPFPWPSHLLFYLTTLLGFDFIVSLGAIFDIAWIRDAGIVEGPFCSAQAVLKQTGDVGVALSTLALTSHTFAVLFFRWKPSRSPLLACFVIGLIWLFLGLNDGLAWHFHHTKGQKLYGNTRYWCWITTSHTGKFKYYGIALEYIWMWVTALMNIFLYIPTALLYFGIIHQEEVEVKGHIKRKYSFNPRGNPDVKGDRSVGWLMMLYSVIYVVTIAPVSVARIMETVWDAKDLDKTVPFSATAIGAVFLSSGGLLNTLLYVNTRKDLLFTRENEIDESASEEEYKAVSRTTSPERELPSNFDVDAGY